MSFLKYLTTSLSIPYKGGFHMPEPIKNYDVVIAGGGPSGLLLASELSKSRKVLVLEKNQVGVTNKSWLTYKDRWKRLGFPDTLILNEFKEWKFQIQECFLTIEDNYICIDEKNFLLYLKSLIIENGGEILEDTLFSNYSYQNDRILINRTYQAKFLIDCCGVNSPIIAKNPSLIKESLYINCYGYIGEFETLENNNYYTMYDEGFPKISCFGVTKVSPFEAFVLFLTYDNQPSNWVGYEERIQAGLLRHGVAPHIRSKEKMANYPTHELKHYTLDHILLFGDSASMSPAFSGMGFNECLRRYKFVAKTIDEWLDRGKFRRKDLKIPKDYARTFNKLLFEMFGILVIHANIKIMEHLMNATKYIDQKHLRLIMRNEVSEKEVVDMLKGLFKEFAFLEFLKSLDVVTLVKILRLISKLSKTFTLKMLYNAVHPHHKITLHDIYK